MVHKDWDVMKEKKNKIQEELKGHIQTKQLFLSENKSYLNTVISFKYTLSRFSHSDEMASHEAQGDTAELLESTSGMTCNKLNKLKGLREWQQGRGEDSWPFHRSIYHP